MAKLAYFYNHNGLLTKYKKEQIVTEAFGYDNDTNFHGAGHIAEYLSLITVKAIQDTLKQNDYFVRTASAEQKRISTILHTIYHLEHPKISTMVKS